jgi:hypothetical protein
VSFLNHSTVFGFYFSCLVTIIIMLAVNVAQILNLNDTYALV